MTEEKKYVTQRYKYTGPLIEIDGGESFYPTLCKGEVVEAEVDINIATITGVERCGTLYQVKPVKVAAEYLDPVEQEATHFDYDTFNPSESVLDSIRKFAREHCDADKEAVDYLLDNGRYAFNSSNIEVGGNHYQQPIQVWDFVFANKIPFDEGCIIKYACRHQKKGGAEDVKKIISYAKHILKTQYGEDYGKEKS